MLGREGGGAAVQRTGKVEQVAEDIDWMQRGPTMDRYAKDCNRRWVGGNGCGDPGEDLKKPDSMHTTIYRIIRDI